MSRFSLQDSMRTRASPLAQLDFFDYITGITIGSIAAEMAAELEEPWKPLTAMVIYGGITLLLSIISNKFPRSRKYLNGTPTILMDHGKLYQARSSKQVNRGFTMPFELHCGASICVLIIFQKEILPSYFPLTT